MFNQLGQTLEMFVSKFTQMRGHARFSALVSKRHHPDQKVSIFEPFVGVSFQDDQGTPTVTLAGINPIIFVQCADFCRPNVNVSEGRKLFLTILLRDHTDESLEQFVRGGLSETSGSPSRDHHSL